MSDRPHLFHLVPEMGSCFECEYSLETDILNCGIVQIKLFYDIAN